VIRLSNRAPVGWVMIVASFGLAFLRSIFFFSSYSTSSGTSSDLFYVGQLITLPVLALAFGGVYYLYKDFEEQFKRRQAELVAPNSVADSPP
jgi:hypothetical protein